MSRERDSQPVPAQWEPGKIVQRLLGLTRISLASLELTHLGEHCPQRGADYAMGDLRDLCNLRDMWVEYKMLVKDSPHDGWSGRVRRLVSVMPESLHCKSAGFPYRGGRRGDRDNGSEKNLGLRTASAMRPIWAPDWR